MQMLIIHVNFSLLICLHYLRDLHSLFNHLVNLMQMLERYNQQVSPTIVRKTTE
jgi:hypothetical protein